MPWPISSRVLGCLREVEVEDCDGLKFLFSLSVARGLSRLEEIKVTRCKRLTQAHNFCFEENPVLPKPASTIVGPSTPPLNQPEIRDGQLLLSLGGNLRSLKLKNCMSLLKLFPPSLLQNLEELIVENCGQLEHVFDLEELNVDDGHVELLPKLKELRLIGLPKLRHICNCSSSRNHFPSSMASAPVGNIIFPKLFHILLNLCPTSQASSPLDIIPSKGFTMQTLIPPSRCSLMKGSLGNTFVFPKITLLSLRNLPQLRSFYPGAHSSQWPLLKYLTVEMCPELDVFAFQQRHGEGNLDMPLFLLPHNLATLDVQSCGSLRSLISPSVAKSLVKLKTLKIGGLDMVEEVVANEGGEATDEITFYKLQHMELLYLPNLTSFSSGGYIFSFPSLEQMLVKECPKMKISSSL
ncbi:hypothetical protein CK203_042935 [Vitis vinifera]|uniref:Disease resistance protein At4g27190-like leucine-rich repeats domain-containing protein n=1 Tax=Vitis vinifera TaxID=29760 RepID=A0A438HUN7_VITVI|nr:hypothetical protein CK203_042935 [Vitis vinifera]